VPVNEVYIKDYRCSLVQLSLLTNHIKLAEWTMMQCTHKH